MSSLGLSPGSQKCWEIMFKPGHSLKRLVVHTISPLSLDRHKGVKKC